jgi:hypothetical protein
MPATPAKDIVLPQSRSRLKRRRHRGSPLLLHLRRLRRTPPERRPSCALWPQSTPARAPQVAALADVVMPSLVAVRPPAPPPTPLLSGTFLRRALPLPASNRAAAGCSPRRRRDAAAPRVSPILSTAPNRRQTPKKIHRLTDSASRIRTLQRRRPAFAPSPRPRAPPRDSAAASPWPCGPTPLAIRAARVLSCQQSARQAVRHATPPRNTMDPRHRTYLQRHRCCKPCGTAGSHHVMDAWLRCILDSFN